MSGETEKLVPRFRFERWDAVGRGSDVNIGGSYSFEMLPTGTKLAMKSDGRKWWVEVPKEWTIMCGLLELIKVRLGETSNYPNGFSDEELEQ